MEIFCDKAEAIFREALESEHDGRRDVASRFVLSGKRRTTRWFGATFGARCNRRAVAASDYAQMARRDRVWDGNWRGRRPSFDRREARRRRRAVLGIDAGLGRARRHLAVLAALRTPFTPAWLIFRPPPARRPHGGGDGLQWRPLGP